MRMKKIFVLMTLAACCASAWADDIATGVVVDKHGTPIPGVKVADRNGSESVLTDMTGRFSFGSDSTLKKITAMYPGYQSVTRRAGKDMVITLSPRTWWNAVPDRYQWFGGVTVATPTGTFRTFSRPKSLSYGLRVGLLKEWGAYFNVATSFCFDGGEPQASGEFYALDAKADFSTFQIGIGGIRRLWSPFHVYVGLGYINSRCVYDCLNQAGEDVTMRSCSVSSVYGEAGIMFRINSIMISAGAIFHPAMKADGSDADMHEKELFVPNSSAIRSTGIQFGIHYIF